MRSAKRRERLTVRAAHHLVSGDAAPSPETEVMTQEQRRQVLAVVDELPERYRSVVTHRYLLGMSEKETSGILGIPQGTVKSRTARALEKLRNSLEPSGDEPT